MSCWSWPLDFSKHAEGLCLHSGHRLLQSTGTAFEHGSSALFVVTWLPSQILLYSPELIPSGALGARKHTEAGDDSTRRLRLLRCRCVHERPTTPRRAVPRLCTRGGTAEREKCVRPGLTPEPVTASARAALVRVEGSQHRRAPRGLPSVAQSKEIILANVS